MPGKPSSTKGRKSLWNGRRRDTSYMSDDANGASTAAAYSRTRRPLAVLVSYISTGLDEPGLSKFSTGPTP